MGVVAVVTPIFRVMATLWTLRLSVALQGKYIRYIRPPVPKENDWKVFDVPSVAEWFNPRTAVGLSHLRTTGGGGGGWPPHPRITRKLRKIATSGKRRSIGRGKFYKKILTGCLRKVRRIYTLHLSSYLVDRASNPVPSESLFNAILFEWESTARGHLTETCWAHIRDYPLSARGVISPYRLIATSRNQMKICRFVVQNDAVPELMEVFHFLIFFLVSPKFSFPKI